MYNVFKNQGPDLDLQNKFATAISLCVQNMQKKTAQRMRLPPDARRELIAERARIRHGLPPAHPGDAGAAAPGAVAPDMPVGPAPTHLYIAPDPEQQKFVRGVAQNLNTLSATPEFPEPMPSAPKQKMSVPTQEPLVSDFNPTEYLRTSVQKAV